MTEMWTAEATIFALIFMAGIGFCFGWVFSREWQNYFDLDNKKPREGATSHGKSNR